MSHPRSSRSNRDCLPSPSFPYPGVSMQQSQLYPKGYLPVHSMATPTSHYSGLEIQHHLQSSHSVLTSTFPGKPDHELTSTKQNLYDYGRFDFNSQSLPQRTCETCGSQYQCTRATDAQGSASPLLEVCDRCLANTLAYTNNPTNTRYSASHCPQTPSFSPPSRFTGYGSSPNYSNQSAIVPSPNVNYPYQNNDLLNASPQRAFKTPVAPSSNRNGSARSNASKSSTSSPVTSHSAASVTGKESFETASKRPHARGYITTLDARLSRLEVMLGDLVPNSSDQLGSNAAKISNPIGNVKPSETREAIPSSKRREKSRNESALERPVSQRHALGISDDPLLDGALEDALLAARPIDRDSSRLYGTDSRKLSIGRELSTIHIFSGRRI